MKARDLINYMIPPLKKGDSIEKARKWMEELRLSELPVAEEGTFLGMVTEDMIFSEEINSEKIDELELKYTDSSVSDNKHYFQVLKTAYRFGIRLVPIIDDKDQYTGVVSIENVVEAFAEAASVSIPGAIIVLSINYRDYSLSEISRIVEQNGFKVLSSHMTPSPEDTTRVLLTLKIDVENIAHLLNVFETNGYTVTEAFAEGIGQEEDRERLDSLMKYLKI